MGKGSKGALFEAVRTSDRRSAMFRHTRSKNARDAVSQATLDQIQVNEIARLYYIERWPNGKIAEHLGGSRGSIGNVVNAKCGYGMKWANAVGDLILAGHVCERPSKSESNLSSRRWREAQASR